MLVQRLSMPQWHRLLGQSILMLQTDGRLLFVWRRANCDSIIFIHDFHGNWLCEEKIQNSNVSIFVNAGKWLQIWKFYVKTHIDVQTVCLKNKTWFLFTWNCWNIFEFCKGIMLRFLLSLSRPQWLTSALFLQPLFGIIFFDNF